MALTEPGKIITPWANAGLKNAIPGAANPVSGSAGYDLGFPAVTMTPPEAGGIPPQGQDFNGILYEVTNALRYMQAGGSPTFDAALAAAVGGYAKGAVVLGVDGLTRWKNQTNGNSTAPETPGSGWVVDSGNLLNVQIFSASGTYTPTAGTKSVVVEAVGGGGSGGASPATTAGQASAGGGGGSGAYGKARFISGFSGVAVTIGAGGAAPAAGLNSGNTGGTTSFGALLSCPGGTGGNAGSVSNGTIISGGNSGNGSAPSGANIVGFAGEGGGNGLVFSGSISGGKGGSNPLGIGGHAPVGIGAGARAPSGYGAGSSGAGNPPSSAAQPGLAGANGVVIVWEYA